MKYIFALPIVFLPFTLFAQANSDLPQDTAATETIHFAFSVPNSKTTNSLYNTIHIIDQRADTADLGFIDPGGMSDTKTVLPQSSLTQQFSQLLNAINDSLAANGELLLQVNRFAFSAYSTRYTREVYYFLRLRLYAHTSKGYKKLALLDTSVTVSFGSIFKSNFAKRIFNSCSDILTNFLRKNITRQPVDDDFYNLDEVVHIDSIEKRSLTAYTTDSLKNGLYLNFASFKNQQPDTATKYSVLFKRGKISALQKTIATHDENGDNLETTIDIPVETFYAIVYHGVAYVGNSYGFYPLQRKNGDFHFIGKIAIEKVGNSGVYGAIYFSSTVLTGFGAIGGLIADLVTSGTSKGTFEIKIDYLTGGFIPVREMEK